MQLVATDTAEHFRTIANVSYGVLKHFFAV